MVIGTAFNDALWFTKICCYSHPSGNYFRARLYATVQWFVKELA